MRQRTDKPRTLAILTILVVAGACAPRAWAEQDHLMGIKVKDVNKTKPGPGYTISNKFGSFECDLKGIKFFMTGSEKNAGDDPRGAQARDFNCYKAKCTGSTLQTNMATDQFGPHGLEHTKVQLVCAPVECGNGIIDGSEDCDGSQLGSCSMCSVDCTCGPAPCEATTSGFCWFLGGDNQSCDSVCAIAGRSYDNATGDYAGSGGTNANCAQVVTDLGFASSVADVELGAGVGCFASISGFGRDTTPTTSTATSGAVGRICACL